MKVASTGVRPDLLRVGEQERACSPRAVWTSFIWTSRMTTSRWTSPRGRLSWPLSVGLVVVLTAGLARAAHGQQNAGNQHRNKEADIVITVVYDNNPAGKELVADWGFGCVVKGLSKTILFDTGARGGVLLSNMRTLGIDPAEINIVVLSHIHSDHTGGLGDFLQQNNNVTVFMPAAFPAEFKDRVRQAGAVVVETEKSEGICPGAFTTPVLGRAIAEQGLCVETAEGIVLVTGCAHPGIVNMTRAAKEASGKPMYAVLGGFHMSGASAEQVSGVIEALKEMGVRRTGPCHCSGDGTRRMMEQAFAKDYIELGVGTQSIFPGLDKGERGE